MQTLKNRIVEAGEKTFYDSGFTAVSVEDVLQESGASRRSFYRYFEDKTALAEEVLKSRGAAFEAMLKDDLAATCTLRQGITAIFHALIKWADQHGAKGCLFQISVIELRDREDIRNISRQHKMRTQEIIYDFLARIHYSDPSKGAVSLMLLIEGAVALANYGAARQTFLNALEAALSMVDPKSKS